MSNSYKPEKQEAQTHDEGQHQRRRQRFSEIVNKAEFRVSAPFCSVARSLWRRSFPSRTSSCWNDTKMNWTHALRRKADGKDVPHRISALPKTPGRAIAENESAISSAFSTPRKRQLPARSTWLKSTQGIRFDRVARRIRGVDSRIPGQKIVAFESESCCRLCAHRRARASGSSCGSLLKGSPRSPQSRQRRFDASRVPSFQMHRGFFVSGRGTASRATSL